ncbi:MAG: hypothetical protein K6T81_10875 [Alicyclobacillus macrosporangiidus]|uniref:hypothetical protein n=1 Tax=Alicyclobacillus macrosporangiidus TaxID=392015 RepID=UPI0026EB53E8|nr:hypothetical protein [Alicyclobacillus macrosporangiidus]MCL6599230.1 hypothetical protein [Alicyclobacillus macrosporangiidus]
MFRRIGKLWRLWEIYSLVQSFTPAGYAADKAWNYILDRLRARDWVFLVFSGVLAIAWGLEGMNWGVQLVLSILRGLGVSHAMWPQGPVVSALGHPTVDRVVWWLAAGLLWGISVLRWLTALMRRLWTSRPDGVFIGAWRKNATGGSVFVHPDGRDALRTDRGVRTVSARGVPAGWLSLALAWVAEILIFV